MIRQGNKYYWRLPFGLGEIQYGLVSRGLMVWIRKRDGGYKAFRLKKGKWDRERYEKKYKKGN